ncbi:MAG: ABC transporter permease [Candidatus Aenigmarchaeota archaeon]|nr:ABC transporter permease [Candidatus Aenigmarchaeota archaeon]
MSGLNTELRIFFRILGETSKGINRAVWMNFVIIMTMAAILSIFGCFLRSSLFITHFVSEIGDSLEVSIYLKQGKDPKAATKTLLQYKNIKSLKIIPKKEAWQSFKKQNNIPEINNPLPDTIRVKLEDRSQIDEFIKVVKKTDFVEDVQYAKQLAGKIEKIGNFINTAAVIIIIALGGLTFSIINNTIHLVIESRKKEIEIMKIMGVSPWYIKAPYIFQGAFYGFWGALLAIVPLFILNSYFMKFTEFFYITISPVNTNVVVLSIFLTGIIVGASGSIISVKKYLKI